MADINIAVGYSPSLQTFLESKLADTGFTYKNWADEDLADYRKQVRDFYRTIQVGICAFCKNEVSLSSAGNCHVEHVVPKSKRREFIFEPKNLCVICSDCNAIKRAKEVESGECDPLARGAMVKLYPRSSKAFLIVHPHFDDWHEHIEKFGTLYVDLTDKGLFTIGACVLNRRLREFGWEAVISDETAVRDAALEWINCSDRAIATRKLNALKKLLILM